MLTEAKLTIMRSGGKAWVGGSRLHLRMEEDFASKSGARCTKLVWTNQEEDMLEYDRKKVGDYLKMCRIKADLTQADVSEALGYSSSQFISNIERGVSVAPLPFLARVMRLYKADVKPLEKIILTTQESILLAKLTPQSRRAERKKESATIR